MGLYFVKLREYQGQGFIGQYQCVLMQFTVLLVYLTDFLPVSNYFSHQIRKPSTHLVRRVFSTQSSSTISTGPYRFTFSTLPSTRPLTVRTVSYCQTVPCCRPSETSQNSSSYWVDVDVSCRQETCYHTSYLTLPFIVTVSPEFLTDMIRSCFVLHDQILSPTPPQVLPRPSSKGPPSPVPRVIQDSNSFFCRTQ